jgi:hypothetical protein
MLESHWRRINRALDHINALDGSIKTWLDSDAYRIVKKHDPKTRRTAYVACLGETPDDWLDLISEAAHMIRSALDHQAFALNSKGYADTHHGAALPPERKADSSFPIFGNVNQSGLPIDGKHAFKSSVSHRDMPPAAAALIESLQPYNRGQDFGRDPLWAIHELSRLDKHRIDLELTAAQLGTKTIGFFPMIDEAAIGIGGPVYDGKELAYWVTTAGYPEPDANVNFTRGVAFGEGMPLWDQPVVPTLRGIRDHICSRVMSPLDKFL